MAMERSGIAIQWSALFADFSYFSHWTDRILPIVSYFAAKPTCLKISLWSSTDLEINLPLSANAWRYLSAQRLLFTNVVKYILPFFDMMVFNCLRKGPVSPRQWSRFSERIVVNVFSWNGSCRASAWRKIRLPGTVSFSFNNLETGGTNHLVDD